MPEIHYDLVVDPDTESIDRAANEVARGIDSANKKAAQSKGKVGDNERYDALGTLSLIGKSTGLMKDFVSGGISGSSISSLVGSIGGPVAQGIAGAALDAIEIPFKALASQASSTANALHALNSSIGAVGMGLTKEADQLRMIPVIGDSLAKIKDSQRQMMETQAQFAGMFSPALAQRLKESVEDLQAQIGLGQIEQTEGIIRSNTLRKQIEAGLQRHGVSGEELNPSGIKGFAYSLAETMGIGALAKIAPGAGGEDLRNLIEMRKILKEMESGPISAERQKEAGEIYKKIIGEELPSGVKAARPAHIGGVMEYERQLQIGAFGQGFDQARDTHTISELMKEIFDLLKKATGDANSPDEAIQRMLDAARNFFNPGGR